MSGNAIETLKQQLAAIDVDDEQGWLEYVPLAARLAALGEPAPLARWTKLVEPFRDLLAAMARPCPVVEVAWPPLVSPLVSPLLAAEAVAHYDSGCPSDRLKQHFERLEVAAELPDTGRFAVSRRIDDCWRVVIDIERQGGGDPQVDLVRLGKVPGYPADDALGRWLVDLRPWEHIQRTRLMYDSPLVIGFRNGYRLRLTD